MQLGPRGLLLASLVSGGLAACARPASVGARGGKAADVATTPAPPTEAVRAPSVTRLGDGRVGAGVLLADVDGRRVAYVADEDESKILVVDVDDERLVSAIDVGGAPGQMVLLKDGRLVVTVRDANALLVLGGGGTARSPLRKDTRIDVAAEPIGLALSPDDRTLVATSGWGRTVTVIDTDLFLRKVEHKVAREPRAAVFSDDGKRIFVTHAVGQSIDVLPIGPIDPKAKAPRAIKIAGTEEVTGRMAPLSEQERAACQGYALAKTDSGRILAPHALVFPGEAEVSSGYGGGEGREAELFHVAVIDEDASKVVEESRVMRIGFGSTSGGRCALPRAATVGKAGLFVACLGDDEIQLFDADALNPQEVKLASWSVPAGPTALALDDEREQALVWSQFAHTLTKLGFGKRDDGTPRPLALSSLTIERRNADAKVERGRIIFHATKDARISNDGRACASCHPDGRDDTLVWSSPKGPRQTPILAGRLEGSAPFGWNGDAPDVSLHLVQTVKRLGGKGIDGEDKEALLAYLGSMKTPKPTPATSDAVVRGGEIYRSEAAGCAGCHGIDGHLPDGATHDVKSRSPIDLQAAFDTPSLKNVAQSAPYFHDGRYPDLRTLLVKSDGKMGKTKHLTPGDLADLEAYLETL